MRQTYYYNGIQGLGNTGRLQTSVNPHLGQTQEQAGLGVGFGFLALVLLYAFTQARK